jgi:geranylgeranyl diphosphate synthase, type II
MLLAPLPTIDAFMRQTLTALGLPANLTEACLYSLLGPGKRMRPILTYHCFQAVAPAGTSPVECLPAAAAIEMVHAFSLVHDDLPGLDNDDLRRGRPTLHKHAGEAMAILAGDCLLTSAFQVIAECPAPAALKARLMHELALSTNAMIAGQVYDTLGGMPAGSDPKHALELIHRNKTGMLIRAACRMGAMCALEGHPGAGRLDPLSAISTYADDIGLMFQIVDDLLDVTQSTAHLGKKSGKDHDAGKLTYPGLMGIERSRAEVTRLHEHALAAIDDLGEPAEPLRQLCTYLAVRTK